MTLAGHSDSEAWIFKWSGTQLENLTATRSENDELLSEFVNATLLDLQHDGTWQVYSARPLVDAESSPQVAPNVTFRLTPSGYVNDKDAVIAEVREISTEDWPTAAPFLSMAGRTGPYTLRVVNGNRAGQKRVSGASIKLNGVELLTPGQVTTSIEFLTIEVTATLAIKNTLDVTLTGNLGDYVTIVVELPPQPLIVLM